MIENKKLLIGILIIIIVLISGWFIWSFTHPKLCLTDLDCRYDICEGCINRDSHHPPCLIKAASWSQYVWDNMPCKCINYKCVEDKETFCQKACEDWINDSCADGIPKSAFLAMKCEYRMDCNCLK